MTLPVDLSSPRGALYASAKRYPGGVRQLAEDMGVKESTLYAKLRGERGYPLDYESEADEILSFMRGREVEDWAKSLHVFCLRHDHLAIPVPRAMRDGSVEGLRQISQMMQEVAEIAQELSAALDEDKADGKLINSREMKRIELACNEALEKIVETRECYRAQHLAAKKKGLVK